MENPSTSLKNAAEFFRLALLAGVCDIAAVVRWSDNVIMSEASPSFVFYDLSTSASQPLSTVTSLLTTVLGDPTPGSPVFMLLGHCHARVQGRKNPAEELLVRLYKMAVPEHFPEGVSHALLSMEDQLWLAHDKVCGSVEEVVAEFTAYLSRYAEYTPVLPT